MRDTNIDFLRFIGLMLIFLVHANGSAISPGSWLQIREFDVPMMIFVSGLSYSGKSFPNYMTFLKRRISRLLFPCWLFLTLYFIIEYCVCLCSGARFLSLKTVVGSYMLLNYPSIGYVWIFRVFFLIMLITPFLTKEGERINIGFLVVVILFLFIIQGVMVTFLGGSNLRIIQDILLYVVAYSIPFILGVRLNVGDKEKIAKESYVLVGLLALGFIVFACLHFWTEGSWLAMHQYKYPPQPYYILWGCLVSSVLWVSRRVWTRIAALKSFTCIGQNTLWIYLWHIPFVGKIAGASIPLIIRFLLLLSVSLALFSLQYMVVKGIGNRTQRYDKILKYFVG